MQPNPDIVNYYDKLASDYDRDRFANSYGRFIDAQERKILSRILTDRNEVVLDLACGSGRLLNFATIGVDASKEMIGVAKSKFPEKELHVADGESIPLENHSADAIISFHLFMHLDRDKIDGIMAEASRVLKANGRLIFDIPSKKRRKLLNYKSDGWHGGFSLSAAEIAAMKGFKIRRTFGILFLPIHRFPKFARPFLTRMDSLLAQSFLKEYSSYLIVELEKNEAA